MTKQERDKANFIRREKRIAERKELLSYRKQVREARERDRIQVQERSKMAQKEKEELERLELVTQGQTQSARRKRLLRARAGISKRPTIFGHTFFDLYNKVSPKKQQASEDARAEGKDHCVTVDSLIAANVKKCLEQLNEKRTVKQRMLRRHFASTLCVLKKYKLQKVRCRMFGVSPKIVKESVHCPRYRNSATISDHTNAKVRNDYELNSVELPDQKNLSKKTLMKTRVLEQPIQVLYQQI